MFRYHKDSQLKPLEKLFISTVRNMIRDKKRGETVNDPTIQELGNYLGIDPDLCDYIEDKIKGLNSKGLNE